MPVPDLEITLIVARTLISVTALLGLACAFSYWRRSMARDAQRMFEQLDLIRGELMLVCERLEQQPVAAAALPAAVKEPRTTVASSPAPRGYEVAARLARSGATSEELVSSCGLSRHEAQLLLRLHGAEAARKVADKSKVVDQAKVTDKPEERRPRLSMVS